MSTFIGIDISESRGCALAALDDAGRAIGSRWSDCNTDDVIRSVQQLAGSGPVTIGVDAPRMPSRGARAWYWEGGKARWRARRDAEQGWGRHSEVIVSAMRLANPQWTPPGEAAPGWMRFGFSLFEALRAYGTVLEVFPSASYTMLADRDEPRLEMPLRDFARGPKDMLDAYIGALTVREFIQGRGCEVGGGDGLGSIVLPGPLEKIPPALLAWPGEPTA
jgi:predicted nuclease with RNAse H fold